MVVLAAGGEVVMVDAEHDVYITLHLPQPALFLHHYKLPALLNSCLPTDHILMRGETVSCTEGQDCIRAFHDDAIAS